MNGYLLRRVHEVFNQLATHWFLYVPVTYVFQIHSVTTYIFCFPQEADLQISSLTIHEDCAKVVHFRLPPVQTQVADVLYRRDDQHEDNWLTYVRQFRPAVFLGIGLSAAVFCLLFVVTESCGHEEEESDERTHCQRWLRFLNRSVLFALASTAKQSKYIFIIQVKCTTILV